ncbi:MAG: peptide ABC transporter substrate-binding protein [Mesotoga sp.]|nr:peptide ABC transporter substrate-binding protein [Mesotoga sp.]
MKKWIVSIILIALITIPVSCFAASVTPQVFTFAGHNDVMTLDVSQMNDEMSALIMYALNESLIRNSYNEIIPGLAESYDVSEDGTVYTFHLRDAKWSDGVPVTAKDFEYSFLRTMNPETGSSQVSEFDSILNAQAYYNGEITDASLVGVKAVDEKTLVLTLTYNDPFFMTEMAEGINFYPIRADYVEKYGMSYASSPETFIGCGPFVLKEWVQGARITLEKNSEYWNTDKVKLERVVELIIPDENTRVGMYDLGEIDAIYSISKVQTIMHPEYGSRSGGTLQYLAFNCSEGLVMENMNLRKALSFAIDREAIVAAITSPGTIPVDRMIDPSIIIDGKSVTEAYPNSTGVPPSGDIEKAKEFLNKALSELGLSKPSDLPSINYVCMDSPVHKQYAEALQAGWKDGLGVDVGISILPVPQAIGALLSGQFDIFLVGQASGVDPATIMNNFTIGNGNNYARWDSKEYSNLIAAQSENPNLAERLLQIQQAEAIILDEAPVAPLWTPGTAYLCREFVKGLHYGRQTGSIEFIFAYIEN